MKTLYLVTGVLILGTNVCAQLLERGDAVRAFVLKGDPAAKLFRPVSKFLRATSAMPTTARSFSPCLMAPRPSVSTAPVW